jgi:glycerophosphoryl diester phosphodiesterase
MAVKRHRYVAFVVASLVSASCTCLTWVSAQADTTTPAVFGHKGGNKWAPENTLASFRKCVERGYGIELDIHRCKTGELIVCHDAELSRTTNGSGFIKDKTLEELRKLSAGKWFSPEFADEKLPSLSEVFQLVDGKVPIMVEIKNTPIEYPGIEDELLKLLSTYKARDQIIIISFDHEVLHRIHKKAPQCRIGFLDSAVPYDIGGYAHGLGAAAWHPAFDGIRSKDVADAHKAGILVNAWTMNKPKDWRAGAEMGLDGIVTDDPDSCDAFLHKNAAGGTK